MLRFVFIISFAMAALSNIVNILKITVKRDF